MNDRFSYEQGDIELRKSQCDFCKHRLPARGEKLFDYCTKYPSGKPVEIVKTTQRCPHLKLQSLNTTE